MILVASLADSLQFALLLLVIIEYVFDLTVLALGPPFRSVSPFKPPLKFSSSFFLKIPLSFNKFDGEIAVCHSMDMAC